MSVLDNWNEWKNFLGDRLDHAQNEGMNDQVISNLAFEIGDYLAKQVEAKTHKKKY